VQKTWGSDGRGIPDQQIHIEIYMPLDTNVAVVNLNEAAVDLDPFVFVDLDLFLFVATDLVPLATVDLDPFEAAECMIEH